MNKPYSCYFQKAATACLRYLIQIYFCISFFVSILISIKITSFILTKYLLLLKCHFRKMSFLINPRASENSPAKCRGLEKVHYYQFNLLCHYWFRQRIVDNCCRVCISLEYQIVSIISLYNTIAAFGMNFDVVPRNIGIVMQPCSRTKINY